MFTKKAAKGRFFRGQEIPQDSLITLTVWADPIHNEPEVFHLTAGLSLDRGRKIRQNAPGHIHHIAANRAE